MLNNVSLDKTKIVYLDHASFSFVDDSVLNYMNNFYCKNYSNQSSLHILGRNSSSEIKKHKNFLAKKMGVKDEEIFFTTSSTSANEFAILSVCESYKEKGKHIIVSPLEHKSIFDCLEKLKKEGYEISVLSVDENGRINLDECISLIRKETILISVMYVNNEVGVVEDIKTLFNLIKEKLDDRPVLHTDVTQAGNVFSLNIKDISSDMMTINSTKLGGPGGVAMLYISSYVKIKNKEEKNIPLPLIAGFTFAFLRAQNFYEEEYKRQFNLKIKLIKLIKDKIKDVTIFGEEELENVSPSITHLNFLGIEGESILLMLDNLGVCVSTGSACASFDIEPSHVLKALNYDDEKLHSNIRVSFGRDTKEEDIIFFVEKLEEVVNRLRLISPLIHNKNILYEKR